MILRAEGQAARSRGAERAPVTLGSFWLSPAGPMDWQCKAHRMGISSASALWAALLLTPFQTSGAQAWTDREAGRAGGTPA